MVPLGGRAVNVRRVVTGVDARGRSCVASDQTLDNVISRRPGHSSCVVWGTGPGGEPATSVITDVMPPTALDDGTIFRIIDYAPGVAARPHRTESVDYIAVLRGSIDLELDNDTVTLGPGDVVVQCATTHNWVNRGDETCRLMVVLLGRVPAR